ncbi:hypothetical protein GCM10010238_43350 [Streptomyces griseoviridis]|uniref:Uncharacterized protein n=1 Tax=Streptomyces griseoviridis TaxID=45398 RepID=A0A918GNC5_STRGD|nr:hypothetical protein GCM10010238_43350 [Streptomyces niveoruber]
MTRSRCAAGRPRHRAGRRAGTGHAVARRLAAYGARVCPHRHVPHDAATPWGAGRVEDVRASVSAAAGDPGDPDARVAGCPGDLTLPGAPGSPVRTAAEALGGRLGILVAHHALSGGDGTLDVIDAAVPDAHWAVDIGSVLLVQAYARLRAALPPRAPGGMTPAGQDHGAGMPGEIAYALQKGAPASVGRSLATALAEHAVTVNTVDPRARRAPDT